MEVARPSISDRSIGAGYLKKPCALDRKIELSIRLVEVSLCHDHLTRRRFSSKANLQTGGEGLLRLGGTRCDEVLVDHVLELHLPLVEASRRRVRQVICNRIQVRLLGRHSASSCI